MTVFNREAYLADAIRSVLDSTFRDIELIIVDDRSKDRSVEIAAEYRDLDDRVRLHVNSQNLGDYENRMLAASLARGTYIKYVDSDDLIYPHGIAVMVQNMERHPEAAMAIAHSLPEEERPYPILLTPEESYRRHFLGRGCFGCGPGGAIIRRDVFESLGGFRPEWGVLSDLELWLRIAAVNPVLLQQPALTWWRKHEGQQYRIGNAERVYLERGFELAKQAIQSRNCPLAEAERLQGYSRLKQRHVKRILSLALRRGSPLLVYSVWRKSSLSAREFFFFLNCLMAEKC